MRRLLILVFVTALSLAAVSQIAPAAKSSSTSSTSREGWQAGHRTPFRSEPERAPADFDNRVPLRPVHTFSIVARDPVTGELGVAVQSHWFSVGPIVPWALPGVGTVATQANAEITYGPRGLDLMAQGLAADEALARLISEDRVSATRQVAMVDAEGRV